MANSTNKKRKKIAVVGAGTMGAGIALTALFAGHEVILQDTFPLSLEKARAYIEKFLKKKDKRDQLAFIVFTEKLTDLSSAQIIIEAAPEKLDIKKDIFQQLDKICPPPAILASNTSTLSVTAIAAASQHPERVAGMHFFNPAPVLPLVEVILAAQSSQETIDELIALAESWGKTPVLTGDTAGFIVNRVARPFYGEALRLLGEGVASYEQIDQIMQHGAGFRMGPFRLMDLIGIDVNAGAMRSMYEQTFGEPRYKPHWIQMQKLAEGALGRKTGKGFYDYGDDTKVKDEDIKGVEGRGQILIQSGDWAPGIEQLCKEGGYETISALSAESSPQLAILVSGDLKETKAQIADLDENLELPIPILVQCTNLSLSEIIRGLNHPERVIGFDGLFINYGKVFTLIAHAQLSSTTKQKIEKFSYALGYSPNWIKESPALIIPRIICQLVNEAAFAYLEGAADAETIDLAMRLGVNYPRGPLEWGKEIGYAKILAVLDHLYDEYHEERYRACILLRRWARQ
jgi:3-hydroxybutyryl-CoA dehydrogenase